MLVIQSAVMLCWNLTPSKQWFVKMQPLAQEVLKAQQNPETKINFYPKRFENFY